MSTYPGSPPPSGSTTSRCRIWRWYQTQDIPANSAIYGSRDPSEGVYSCVCATKVMALWGSEGGEAPGGYTCGDIHEVSTYTALSIRWSGPVTRNSIHQIWCTTAIHSTHVVRHVLGGYPDDVPEVLYLYKVWSGPVTRSSTTPDMVYQLYTWRGGASTIAR